jgi:integrase
LPRRFVRPLYSERLRQDGARRSRRAVIDTGLSRNSCTPKRTASSTQARFICSTFSLISVNLQVLYQHRISKPFTGISGFLLFPSVFSVLCGECLPGAFREDIMPRVNLTPAFALRAKAEAGAERTIFWSERRSGFGLMVLASGRRSWVCQYRSKGRSRRATIDGKLSLSAAEKEAKKLQGLVAHGRDPVEEERRERLAQTNSLRAIAEEFFQREGKKLRSNEKRQALFARHIFPRLGARPINEIKRSEIVRLLDHIEDNSGAPTAQIALFALSRLFNWYASRDDDFLSPIVRGMSRIKQKDRARERILSDDELRAVWRTACDRRDPFAEFIKFLLLSAARRTEAAGMRWSELNGDWTLPAARNKVNQELIRPLSKAAQEILASLPRINEFVFTYGHGAISGFSKGKAQFDKACGVSDWTLHDLRRTARSLMSRAGVNENVAERCLGHVIPGVRGVYDRHKYNQEMAHAYEALAALIERIVSPQENVVNLRGAV